MESIETRLRWSESKLSIEAPELLQDRDWGGKQSLEATIDEGTEEATKLLHSDRRAIWNDFMIKGVCEKAKIMSFAFVRELLIKDLRGYSNSN